MSAENQGTDEAAQHFNVGTQHKLKLMHRKRLIIRLTDDLGFTPEE